MSPGDDDSLIELARKVHVEIDRNEQIDSRMMGYLRRPDAQGVSDVADAAPSSVVAANGQVVHSPDGSTEQATTLQVGGLSLSEPIFINPVAVSLGTV